MGCVVQSHALGLGCLQVLLRTAPLRSALVFSDTESGAVLRGEANREEGLALSESRRQGPGS